MSSDALFMGRALDLARRGLYGTDPNPRVGAVLVRDGAIVGEGYHAQAGTPHAEVHALRQAGDRARGATCYVTLEPCSHFGRTPPCANALVEAGVARVVVAMEDPNPLVSGQGIAHLRAAGIQVDVGEMGDTAAALNPGFISRMCRHRPWLRLKIAASLDGRTALANGQSQWITGAQAREDVHHLRARSSAVMTGIGTVLADNPRLTPRLETQVVPRPPPRIILDRALRTPVDAALFDDEHPVLILHGADAPPVRRDALLARGASLDVLPLGAAGLDLNHLLTRLDAMEINELLVEAGPTLAGALLAGSHVDELVLYMAPKFMGHDARPLAFLGPFADLDSLPPWRIHESRQLGPDLKIVLRPEPSLSG